MTRSERYLAMVLLLVTLASLLISIEAREARISYRAAHADDQSTLRLIQAEQRLQLTNMEAGKRFRERLEVKMDRLLAATEPTK